MLSHPLAFVDVETTGLSPSENRIAEIGVVTVRGARVERWTTMVRTPAKEGRTPSLRESLPDYRSAPPFGAIASELLQRLSGHLFIAHNARFDLAFLRAEFRRSGHEFNPDVLCSVMLSRELQPHLAHHDLDSLAATHGLRAEIRHRALPDAELLWRWWHAVHRYFPHWVLEDAIERVRAGPVLPEHLAPSLVDGLPESPGAYVLHGQDDEPLLVGAAHNLRLRVRNYFRVDQASPRALEYSHRITRISWRATRGILGARLHAVSLDALRIEAAGRGRPEPAFAWRLLPASVPCVEVGTLEDMQASGEDVFGMFSSLRKARNGLVRAAVRHDLCPRFLGISGDTLPQCATCAIDNHGARCFDRTNRVQQLVRVFRAIERLRVPAWPHDGAIGIRERSDIHVIDRWQFLGTAQSEGDLHALCDGRAPPFHARAYRLIRRTMNHLPPENLVDLSRFHRPPIVE